MAVVRGATFRVDGLEELEAQFARIGKMPKKYLTKAAKAGMGPVERDAKAAAPVGRGTTTSGSTKRSIKKKMETPNKRNKTVYRLRFDPKFTNVFRKPTTGVYGGKTPYTYYPNAVEYGHLTKRGRVQGKYYLANAMSRHSHSSLEKVVKSLQESIDEIIASR